MRRRCMTDALCIEAIVYLIVFTLLILFVCLYQRWRYDPLAEYQRLRQQFRPIDSSDEV